MLPRKNILDVKVTNEKGDHMNAASEERQLKTFEKIAEALEKIAIAQIARVNIEQARLEIERTKASTPI